MNQPGNQQNPGQGLTVIQLDPPVQGQPQFAAPPQYVAASPPGVAVQLPGPQSMTTTPGYPSVAAQGYTEPVPQPAAAPQPTAQPAQQPFAQGAAPVGLPPTVRMNVRNPAQLAPRPRSSDNNDQLLAGAGRTVYEFTGAHSEEARSGGKHQTFIAEGITLTAPVQEERHTNLSRNGGVTMFIVGLAVVGIVGALAYFLSAGAKQGGDEQAATEPAAAPAPAPQAPVETPVPTPPVDPNAVPGGTPAPPVDPAAEGGAAVPPAPAPDPAPAPADDTTPPADEPAEDPKPAPDEPAKKKSSGTKKKSAPPPEPEKKKRQFGPITPSKPPRGDGLNNLPSPD